MQPIHVLYGTETYNSQDLADRTGEAIAARGLPVSVLDMGDFDPASFPTLGVVLVITSTFGAGEPPANAADCHDWVMADDAPSLAGLRFAVCGLGDRAYPDFCQCGKDFDAAFARLGGQRIAPRQDCDLDFEGTWEEWLDNVLGALGSIDLGAAPAAPAAPLSTRSIPEPQALALVDTPAPGKAAPLGTRKNPFFATVTENYNLNAPGGEKETRHLSLSLVGSGLEYRVGDSLGLFPRNDPELVYRVLWATGLRGDEAVEVGGDWLYLRDALIYRLDVTWPDPKLVNLAAEHGAQGRDYFAMLLSDSKAKKAFLAEHHVVDILSMARAGVDAATLCKALRVLAPRLYSISSSPKAHPGEVHLTVDVVRYAMHGLDRKGISSCFLAERAVVGAQVPVYVQKSADFHLTDDDGAPIIMVGPGTGIAPFRAFLEEREMRGAQGYSWLFFGARQSSTDHLYRDQVQRWVDRGVLTRLDLAFSRDQKEKIYVQDRMWENGPDFWAWLDAGSHVYICGDASRMAKDVHETMVRIISTYGGRSPEQAEAYLEDMRKAGRYARDVY